MGGRVSMPRGPGGTTEASKLPATPGSIRKRGLNARQLAVPLGALTLACIFYVYSRTSIQAAKVNAQRRREADGGSISWRNEGLRRHGQMEQLEERTIWAQLTSGKQDDSEEETQKRIKKGYEARARLNMPANPIEEGIRRRRAQTSDDDE